MKQCDIFLSILQKTVIVILRIYQWVNPFKGTCRFIPTCSEYTIQAVTKYGILKGTRLGMSRILKCHKPNGGIDLVK
jgi:uncharacterized protein